MNPKKSILISYNAMNIGGSTTSLLSLLNRLNYEKYDVDLLLNDNYGDLLEEIPPKVHLLPQLRKYTNRKTEYFHRLISLRYMFHYFVSKWIVYRDKVDMHGAQYREWKDINFYRMIDKEYDVAIAFLEGECCKFVARHIKAKRKIAWIHVDYGTAGFDPKYDEDTMCLFDNVVLVSEQCKKSFDRFFPHLAARSVTIENILVSDFVRNRANKEIKFQTNINDLNFVTVCRVAFESKALDRAVAVIFKLKDEIQFSRFRWYIIGDGEDMDRLKQLVAEANLNDNIILLGKKTNVYPYLKGMDVFFLPSKFEGKPMAVTEGFMMGLPALVTNYASAHEQIREGIDGMVVENSNEGIYAGIKYVLEDPEVIDEWKKNVIEYDYSNVEEIKKVEAIIDGIM